MSDVITRPHQVAPDHRVKIPRSRVREMLDRLGATMSNPTTTRGAAEFGATSDPHRAGRASAASQTAPGFLHRALYGPAPLAMAVAQHRESIEAAGRLAASREGCGDAVVEADRVFYARAVAAMPLFTVRDTMALVAWLQGELIDAGYISANTLQGDDLAFEVFANGALAAVHDFLTLVQGAGSDSVETSADAELLEAFGEFLKQERHINHEIPAEREATDEEWSAFYASRERLRAAPVQTLAGILAKLAGAMHATNGAVLDMRDKDSMTVQMLVQARAAASALPNVLERGAAKMVLDCLADLYDSDAFNHGIGELAEQSQRRRQSPDTITGMDFGIKAAVTFGVGEPPADGVMDTIAAFDAAGAGMLSLPQSPTFTMVEAGAAAAGVTPEAARAIYEAMAGAYRESAA